MLQKLQELLMYWDYTTWYYLNTQWHHPVLDAIIPYLRNPWTWAPLYLFLLVFMLMNFGRRGLVWCLFFLLTFALADFISASLVKPLFQRVRPCNNPYLSQVVHIIVPCGSGYSFPSSHASNHFALGVFAAASLESRVRKVWYWAMLWAFSVAYAQVYVGVHYPLDVLCGGVLGGSIGVMTSRLFLTTTGLEKKVLKKQTAGS
ncbi:MAG: phosphatase PAP2 family protein [Sphingobacteriales bacterium]|nr:MAG: phosphatase PAP2 family protein [Sphingobacteriales bacterium]